MKNKEVDEETKEEYRKAVKKLSLCAGGLGFAAQNELIHRRKPPIRVNRYIICLGTSMLAYGIANIALRNIWSV